MVEKADAGDTAAMPRLNWTFHRSNNHLVRSRKLLAVLRTVWLDVSRDYLAQAPTSGARSNKERAAILEAMRSRDAALAQRVMEEHLRESGAGLANHPVEQGLTLT